MGLWHPVKNPFIPRQPSESLLTTHCVGICAFKFHRCWTTQFPAPLVFVVLRDMKCINDFLHIQPHLAEVPRKWKWVSRESRRKIILSYDNMCHLNILKWPEVDSTANADSNQTSTIRKTCAGVEVNNVPPWIMSPRTLLTSEYCPPRHYSPVNNVLSSEQCPPLVDVLPRWSAWSGIFIC